MNKYISIGGTDFFRKDKLYIMGILNMTPDSFSDGGSYADIAAAMARVRQMIAEGADIIDVGGESSRPGYQKISDASEIARIVPVITEIKKHFNIPVSVDTYKSAVAKAAIAAGADMINDIWGLKYDDKMAEVIADSGVACCLMHNRSAADAGNIIAESIADLKESLAIAQKAGISSEKIILDPGIGFGKTYVQNLQVMKHLADFGDMGYPLLLGTSRKSMIGLTLNLPVNERMEGTLATSVLAAVNGYSFVRVHDIRENARAIQMAEAILHAPEPCDTGRSEGWHRVYIGLGSNMGDRCQYLKEAIRRLTSHEAIRNFVCSDFLETKPYGGVVQDNFLNACAGFETTLSAGELLKFLNLTEKDLGRERLIHWGPRTLDLDILLYDDCIVDEPDLKIPHIDMQNREFVLKPLAEIAGHVQHPQLQKTIHQLYMDLMKGER